MKKLASVVVLLVFIVALTAGTAMAKCYSETNNYFDEFWASVPHPCKEGIEIHLTGTFHWLFQSTWCDNNNISHSVIHRDIQNLVGIDDDNERYVSAEVWNNHYNIMKGGPPPAQGVESFIIVLVGQQSGIIMRILFNVHLTINANHEIIMERFFEGIFCEP